MLETPRVWNKHYEQPTQEFVYIGRPRGDAKNKWSNPFSHLVDSKAKYKVETRDDAVEAFERMLERAMANHPWLRDEIIRELGGKHLVCWCAPARCHGDVLLRIANPNLKLGERSERPNKRNTKTESNVASAPSTSKRVDSRKVAVQQKNRCRVPRVDRRAAEV